MTPPRRPEPPVITGYRDLVGVRRGRFADLYRAQSWARGHEVAVKVWVLCAGVPGDAGATDGERAAVRDAHRFVERSVDHPFVVPILDAGTAEDGWPYVAEEFFPEGSWADRRSRRQDMSWEDVVTAGAQTASGLATVEAAGSNYGAVRPENLLIAPSGATKLDAAIASFPLSIPTHEGSPADDWAHLEPASGTDDGVYSLASTLYTLMAGEVPFPLRPGESFAAWLARREGPPPRLDAGPGPLADLLQQAMATDPDDRPDAADLADRLWALRPEWPSSSRAGDPPPRKIGPRSPNRGGDPTEGSTGRWGLTIGEGAEWVTDLDTGTEWVTDLESRTTTQVGGESTSSGLVDLHEDIPPRRPRENGRAPRVSLRIGLGHALWAVSACEQAVWGTHLTDGSVVRADPDTRQVARVPMPARGLGVAAGDDAAWVVCPAAGAVLRIDPETNRVSHTIPVGANPIGVVTGGGSVWVTGGRPSRVWRIDPDTNEVTATIDTGVGGDPWGIAWDSGAVWLAGFHGIRRIDSDTQDVVETLSGETNSVAVAGGTLWATRRSGPPFAHLGETLLIRVDPASGAETPVARARGTVRVIAGAGAVWVFGGGRLWRIDPTTQQPTHSLAIRENDHSMSAAGTEAHVWVAAGNAVVRIDPGGRSAGEDSIPSSDPP